MSFKIILGGVILIMLSVAGGIASVMFIKDAGTLAYYAYFNMGVGVIFGIIMCVIALTTNGIIGPFMSAKTNGHNVVAVLTASGRVRLRHGKENNGIIPTRDGSFIVMPNSMFSWPNGVKGGYAYYRQGAVIPPQFNAACSVLKESGVTDARKVEELAVKEPDAAIEFK